MTTRRRGQHIGFGGAAAVVAASLAGAMCASVISPPDANRSAAQAWAFDPLYAFVVAFVPHVLGVWLFSTAKSVFGTTSLRSVGLTPLIGLPLLLVTKQWTTSLLVLELPVWITAIVVSLERCHRTAVHSAE